MKSIKTLAFASLIAFSTLAFTACGSKSGDDAAADSTAVVAPDDMLQDETTNAVDDASMMQTDSTKTDSTATGM
jgi:hypothetical protein